MKHMNDKTTAASKETTVVGDEKTVAVSGQQTESQNTAEPKKAKAPLTDAISEAVKTAPAKREVFLDEGDDELEPGIYPQDDGTVNVVLGTPIKRSSGEPIAVVKVLGMPLVKDMNKAGGRMQLMQMMDSAHMIVAPTVTQPTINPKTWESMDVSDTTMLMGGILHFFVPTKSSASATG